MNIGVFVPNYIAKRMKDLLTDYPNVKFRFFVYKELREIKEYYERNLPFLDGVLFSGLLAYMLVEEEFGEFKKPAAYLKLSDADFYKKLFHMTLERPDIDFSKVFIDFHAESKEVQTFIDQFPEHKRPRTIEQSEIYVSEDVYERLLNIHQDYHQSGQVNLSLTRFVNIIDALETDDISYDYFEISNETIHKTLFDLINEVNLHLLKDKQIVCGQLTLGQIPESIREIRFLNVHSLLLDYNKQINHQLQIREGTDDFTIITTYASLQNLTNDFTSCSILEHLEEFIQEPIHIGWSIGKTFIQAQTNAKKACDYSIHNQVSSTYIIENNESFIGPLIAPLLTKDESAEPYNQALFERLEASVNMTKDHIHKILLAFKLLNSEQIASAEFAEIIGITVRSANRILKRAEEEKLVLSTVDTVSGLQGRPRKLYQLNHNLLN